MKEEEGGTVEKNGHRHLFLLSGRAVWCRTVASRMLKEAGHQRVLWVTDAPSEQASSLSAKKLCSRLGSELDALVFDAWAGFDPDAFGAATGMVCGGGAVLLLTPPLAEWPDYADPVLQRFSPWPFSRQSTSSRFLQRLVRIVLTTDFIRRIDEQDSLPQLPSSPPGICRSAGICCTPDQQRAVKAVCRVVHGHRRRPLVLTADRGRGKSSALGIAAAQLLQQGVSRILVTAPGLDAAAVVFRQAGRLLPGAQNRQGLLQWRNRHIRFVAPDALIQHPQQADLLLVDEAAAIPAPLLESLLKQHSRIVFSTTIHGYEGTGRGFAVRFRDALDRLTPEWKKEHLSRPVRWAENDPVEQFTFRALLLNASPVSDEIMKGARPESCESVQLSRDQLLDNEPLLTELFGLLVLAHYRTRPADLYNLLDGPMLSVHAILHNGYVAAVALVAREGGLDEALADEIWLGRRRIHGHLLPQSLAVHAGFPEAARMSYARIMRLAVHPAAQRRGLGTRLVMDIVRREKETDVDFIGTSFGATAGLLDFWHQAAFHTVRLGLRREASSGSHAAFMLHPVSSCGMTLHKRLRLGLHKQLPALLGEPLCNLEADIIWRLLQNFLHPPDRPDMQEWRDITSFSSGKRGYEVCMASIKKLVISALAERDIAAALDEMDRDLLIARVLQNQDWKSLAVRFSLSGKKQLIELLRKAVQRLINCSSCDPI